MQRRVQQWKPGIENEYQNEMCLICKKTCRNQMELIEHLTEHVEANFSCKTCFEDVQCSLKDALNHIEMCQTRTKRQIIKSRWNSFKIFQRQYNSNTHATILDAIQFSVYVMNAQLLYKLKCYPSTMSIPKTASFKNKIPCSVERQIEKLLNSSLFGEIMDKIAVMSRRSDRRNSLPIYINK